MHCFIADEGIILLSYSELLSGYIMFGGHIGFSAGPVSIWHPKSFFYGLCLLRPNLHRYNVGRGGRID